MSKHENQPNIQSLPDQLLQISKEELLPDDVKYGEDAINFKQSDFSEAFFPKMDLINGADPLTTHRYMDSGESTTMFNAPITEPIRIISDIPYFERLDKVGMLLKIRAANAVVTELLNTIAIHKGLRYRDAAHDDDVNHLSAFEEADFDFSDHGVNNILRLTHVIEGIIYKLIWRSGFYRALDTHNRQLLSKGKQPLKHKIIIGTDPVIERYLSLVRKYDNIVSSLDKRLMGKIIISLGVEGPFDKAALTPFMPGYLAFYPEPLEKLDGVHEIKPQYRACSNHSIIGVIDIDG